MSTLSRGRESVHESRAEPARSPATGPQVSPTADHIYATGTWTASVTVVDNKGGSSNASSAPITVAANLNPVALLNATPTSGSGSLPVTVSGAGSSDPDGRVVSYVFDFGDGSPPAG